MLCNSTRNDDVLILQVRSRQEEAADQVLRAAEAISAMTIAAANYHSYILTYVAMNALIFPVTVLT